MPPGTYAVVLAADNERHLKEIAKKLNDYGIEHTLICENTAPYDGQATAIGVTPGRKSKLFKYFSALPLLR